MNSDDINIPTPYIATALPRWKRNRDFIDGEYPVKAEGHCYLPKANPEQSDAEYHAYKDNVVFYPAASRTADGLLGLIFRKPATLDGSAGVISIADIITIDGDGLEDFAEEVTRETLITNFTGLLTDLPQNTEAVSRAAAIAAGQRPFVAMYRAESILEVTQTVIANRKAISRVRLLEDADTVRELVLVDGVYTQRLWSSANGAWTVIAEIVPTNDGKPLDHIPFVIVNTAGKLMPTPAALDNAVNLNLSHYRASGRTAVASYFLSAPIPYVTGIKTVDDQGRPVPVNLTVAPGSLWTFEDVDTKVGYLEFTGAGMASLRADLDRLEQYLATVGARILASDKAAAETAEALSIRRSSENSVLASATRTISRQIQQALQFVANWMDGQDVSFALNTDFLPTPMDSLTLTAMVQAWQNGAISYDTLFYSLQQGEVIAPTITMEDEHTKIEQAQADRPPTTPTSTTPPTSSSL